MLLRARPVEVEVLARQQRLLGLLQVHVPVCNFLPFHVVYLRLQIIATLAKHFYLLHQTIFTLVDVTVRTVDHLQDLRSQVRYRLVVLELLEVGDERLQTELKVELEARDDRRHVVELVQSIGEILVDERVTDVLVLELADQFRD